MGMTQQDALAAMHMSKPPLLLQQALGLVFLVLVFFSAGCDRAGDREVGNAIQEQVTAEQQSPAVAGQNGKVASEIRTQLDQSAPGVADIYAQREYAPLWQDDDARAELIAALQGLADDGLDPRDYGLVELQQAFAVEKTDATGKSAADILATRHFVQALSHLRHGRVDPQRLNVGWKVDPDTEADRALLQAATRAADSGHVSEAFDQARPQHPTYTQLRAALSKLHAAEAKGGWPQVPDTEGPAAGSSNPPMLRARLAAGGYLPGDALHGGLYDQQVADAVSQFQAEHYLKATGELTPATRAALNVPVQARIAQLRANLERARWFLPAMLRDGLVVDVAGYRIRYFKDGKSVWESRVQVGEPDLQTPLFQSKVTHVTLNPSWGVPQGIMQRDFLPRLRRDPNYARRQGITITDMDGDELDPDDVDWEDIEDMSGFNFKQKPGPRGALGRVAIRFPNTYDVYLHETPHKELFDRETRAFSNGCIRVEKAFELTYMLLAVDEAVLQRQVADKQTRDVKLPVQVPIMLVYWTVDLHEGGRVGFRPDIYKLDAAMLAAMEQSSVAAQAAQPQDGRANQAQLTDSD